MNEWMKNPLFQTLDPAKKELLKMAAGQTAGKSGRSMAAIMLSIITAANKRGIRFSQDETGLILQMLKDGKSAEDQKKIDDTFRFVLRTLSGQKKN